MWLVPKNTDSRNSKPKNTPMIPVCKYGKSTPWGPRTPLEVEKVSGSPLRGQPKIFYNATLLENHSSIAE